jgi:hypothetical protein
MKHMIAKKMTAEEGAEFFSILLPTSQFANIWLAIRHADSKKVINQYVSLSESSLCPCCRQIHKTRLTLRRKEKNLNQVIQYGRTTFLLKKDNKRKLLITFSCCVTIQVSKLNENIVLAIERHMLVMKMLGCCVIFFHTPTKKCRMQKIKQTFL